MNLTPHDLIESIDRDRFHQVANDLSAKYDFSICRMLQEKYGGIKRKGGAKKYLDYERHLRVAIRRALALDLDRSERKSILDIGTGAGYFPLVCREFGHRCHAIDLRDEGLYHDLTTHFAVPKTTHAVRAYQRLPAMGDRFDIVTGFAVGFSNGAGRSSLWGRDEWRFFVTDLMENVIADGGMAWFQLNPSFPGGARYDAPLRAYFEEQATTVSGPHVVFVKPAATASQEDRSATPHFEQPAGTSAP